jgi:SAM-dependent methyltransferase
MSVVEHIHGQCVSGRRVRRLAELLSGVLPRSAAILDVGCGDGALDRALLDRRPDLRIEGIDVLVRSQTHIPVIKFDGSRIPFPDRSVEVVMFVDVLHHTDTPELLLREATRVASRMVVIKDHHRDGLGAQARLRFMDHVGNARYGVALPYNYWSQKEWHSVFSNLELTVASSNTDLALYPWPFDYIFGGPLHFLAALRPPYGLASRTGV